MAAQSHCSQSIPITKDSDSVLKWLSNLLHCSIQEVKKKFFSPNLVKRLIRDASDLIGQSHLLTAALVLFWNHKGMKETSVLKFLVLFGANPSDLNVNTKEFQEKFSNRADQENRLNAIEFLIEAQLAYILERKSSTEDIITRIGSIQSLIEAQLNYVLEHKSSSEKYEDRMDFIDFVTIAQAKYVSKYKSSNKEDKDRMDFITFVSKAQEKYLLEHKSLSEDKITRTNRIEFLIEAQKTRVLELKSSSEDKKNLIKFIEFLIKYQSEYALKLKSSREYKLQELLLKAKVALGSTQQIPSGIGEKRYESPQGGHVIALSLDGGGIRGLISSLTLRFVSNQVFGDEEIASRVHWITGTSTGAIIALALTKQKKMTPTECMQTYWTLKDEVFNSILDREKKQTENLEQLLKEKLPEENKFSTRTANIINSNKNNWIPHVCVTTLNISKRPGKLEIKRNYEVEGDGGGIVPVEELEFWKAARMSSAAPTYFEPFQYERKLYVDGGLSANSPVDVICREIDNSNFKIGALLSIGTGVKHPIDRYLYDQAEGGFGLPVVESLHRFFKAMGNQWFWIKLLEEQSLGSDGKTIDCVSSRCIRKEHVHAFARLCPIGIKIGLKLKDKQDEKDLIDMLWTSLQYLTGGEAQKEIIKFAKAYEKHVMTSTESCGTSNSCGCQATETQQATVGSIAVSASSVQASGATTPAINKGNCQGTHPPNESPIMNILPDDEGNPASVNLIRGAPPDLNGAAHTLIQTDHMNPLGGSPMVNILLNDEGNPASVNLIRGAPPDLNGAADTLIQTGHMNPLGGSPMVNTLLNDEGNPVSVNLTRGAPPDLNGAADTLIQTDHMNPLGGSPMVNTLLNDEGNPVSVNLTRGAPPDLNGAANTLIQMDHTNRSSLFSCCFRSTEAE